MTILDITKRDVCGLTKLIREKKLSPTELLNYYLRNIEKKDRSIKAWVQVTEELAQKNAKIVEEKLMKRDELGILAGIPFAVKDNFYTKEIKTEAGSKVLTSFTPTYDARAIELLAEADAFMLGKTTLTEFAMSGYIETRNPWNYDHSPGGSSSGSAAAVAASMVPMALGTQTLGSLIRPAAYCGVVSLKPTLGSISNYGLVPVSWTLDTVGVLTKTVRDQALALNVLIKHDVEDPISLKNHHVEKNVTTVQSLEDIVIGVPNTYFFDRINEEIDQQIKQSIELLQDLGATIIEYNLPDNFEEVLIATQIIFISEAYTNHYERYNKYGQQYDDFIKELFQKGQLIPQIAYTRSLQIRNKFIDYLRDSMADIDILLTPATPELAPKGNVAGDPKFNSPFSISGFPTLAVPVAKASNDLPIGMQMVSKPFEEAKLLSVAHLFEQQNSRWASPLHLSI